MSDYREWIGQTDESTDAISPRQLELLAATLNLPSTGFSDDSHVPLLWHWLYFVPTAPTADLGIDGHPRLQNLPPSPMLLRRMFAGSEVVQHSPLRAGKPARRRREVTGVRETKGSAGDLLIVDVRQEIHSGSELAIVEEQTLIYTDKPYRALAEDPGDSPPAPWEWEVHTTSALLFRFSALTFNAHRIHYDRRYAVEDECYPDLVVHGPLIAILLVELASMHGAQSQSFTFRARAPLFVGETLQLRGGPTATGSELRAYRGSTLIMEASTSEK